MSCRSFIDLARRSLAPAVIAKQLGIGRASVYRVLAKPVEA